MDPQSPQSSPSPIPPQSNNGIKSKVFSIFKKSRVLWPSIILLIALVTLPFVYLNQNQLPKNDNPVIIDHDQPTVHNTDPGDFTKMTIPQRQPPFFKLEPTTTSLFGILPQQSFTLTTQSPVDAEFIKNNLNSPIPMNIETKSDQEFILSPASILNKNELFNIQLQVKDQNFNDYQFDRDYGWAYQTQGDFRVTSHIPGDQKTDVPIKTGIEIVFSQDDYQDPQSFIEISPTIKFRLERHQETLAIVPEQPLNYQTIYTVTLRKGLNLKSRNDPIEENLQYSFQTVEPPAPGQRNIHLNLRKTFIQMTPQQPVQVQIYRSSNFNQNDLVKAKIYQFSDSQQFMDSRQKIDTHIYSWYRYFPRKEQVPVDNLSLINQAEITVQKQDYTDYLELEPIPKGFYLIQFWYQDDKKMEQLWLQSTDLGGYVSVGRKHSLIWINNISNSEPVGQANINLLGQGANYQTNNEGWAVFDTPSGYYQEQGHYLQISKDQNQLILPVANLKGKASADHLTSNDFWSYLYQERRLYKPEDTVNFWGVVKNRNTDQPPNNIKVVISSGYSYQSKPQAAQWTTQVNAQSNGSFIGQVDLPNVPSGWYQMQLMVDDVNVRSSSFQVIDYTKPEMKIEVSADKPAIFTDEQVTFRAVAQFFDGTPASNIPISIHGQYRGPISSDQITSQQGELVYQYQPKYHTNYNYPRHESITFSPARAESSTIEGHSSVYVYGSKLMITTDRIQNNDQAIVKATINHVDLTNFSPDSRNTDQVKGSPATNQVVQLTITKNWYERVESGTYYDFIEKVTSKKYTYKHHQESIYNQELTTDQLGQIEHQFQMEARKSYQAVITVLDEDQHNSNKTLYYYYYPGSNYYYYNYQSSTDETPKLTINKEENTYSIGENVEVSIKRGEELYPDNDKNKFLFITAQRGNQQINLETGPTYNFNFETQHLPNIYVGAVMFTGSSYYPISAGCYRNWHCGGYYNDEYAFDGLLIKYKETDSQLELELNTDQVKYQPGETAKLTVAVTQDSQPVGNSTVNIALVDAALAAIGGAKKPNILPDLYQTVPHQIYFSYHTHEPLFAERGMAEKGGGGGGEREIFKDIGFFGQASTNSQGLANFEFTLPDNITTWLIYGQSVTTDLQAGQFEDQLVVTKDFFVTNTFPQNLLTADKTQVTASAFGIGLNPTDQVKYQMAWYENDQEISKQDQSQQAFQTLEFELPSVEEGDYQVSIRGQSGNYQDGVKLPVTIANSRVSLPYQTVQQLAAGQSTKLDSTDQILTNDQINLVVSDQGKGIYYRQLHSYCYGNSNRLEKKLSQIKANQLLENYFDEDYCVLKDKDLSVFQGVDGGLSQVHWGGSHLDTSLWSTIVAADLFDQQQLKQYFDLKLLEDRSGNVQQLKAAWGLINLNQPALSRVQSKLTQLTSFEEKIYAALALANAGETETARNIFYDILADYGYIYEPYIRIQSSDKAKQDDLLYDTSLALVLGDIVDDQYNQGFYEYLQDYDSRAEDIVLDLSDMIYLENQIEQLPDQDTQFIFTSKQRTENKTLTKGHNVRYTLAKNELDNFKVNVVQGKAEVVLNYHVGRQGLDILPTDNRLSVNRTYQNVSQPNKEIKPGDIVKITINYQVDKQESPLGSYQIIDFLPSGLTYLSNPGVYGYDRKGWARQSVNQQVEMTFYYSLWSPKSRTGNMVYFARANSTGEYLAEPTIIQSNRFPQLFNFTDEQTLVINKP